MRSYFGTMDGKEDCCWHPWKCVSLVRSDGKTLDLTIDDDNKTICFLHVAYHLICKPPTQSRFLRDFKLQKIKLKLQAEARHTQLHLSHMIQLAIFRTLIEKQKMAAFDLQSALKIDP